MSQFEKITIEDVILRERKDGTGEFPVLIAYGVTLSMSSSGNVSINKRRVSVPLNGFTVNEGREAFPKGSTLEGFKIVQKTVDPYEWTTPDGELRTDNVRYELEQIDAKPAEQETAPQSTSEPVLNEIGEDRPM